MFTRCLCLLSMVAALWVIAITPSSAQVGGAGAGLAVVDRQLVQEVRVGRTHANYTYRIVVSNSGPARSGVVSTSATPGHGIGFAVPAAALRALLDK